MSIDVDLGKIMVSLCTFICTIAINRNIKRLDMMNDKLDKVSLDVAELRGSISGRFLIDKDT